MEMSKVQIRNKLRELKRREKYLKYLFENIFFKIKMNNKKIIELEADNLIINIGKECKVIRGSPNKEQKNKLVKIKQWYDKWEEYL